MFQVGCNRCLKLNIKKLLQLCGILSKRHLPRRKAREKRWRRRAVLAKLFGWDRSKVRHAITYHGDATTYAFC